MEALPGPKSGAIYIYCLLLGFFATNYNLKGNIMHFDSGMRVYGHSWGVDTFKAQIKGRNRRVPAIVETRPWTPGPRIRNPILCKKRSSGMER